jgi:Glycerol uptake facilitator and related permeases (Major Intrinsic Protein Family)
MYPNLLGEFVGTMVLCACGNAVVANLVLKDTKGNGAGWVHVNWGWSFGLMIAIMAGWALGTDQADFNPAVTLCKTLAGAYTIPHALATMVAEVLGGIAGGCVAYLTYLNHWAATEDPGLKLAVFATGPARRDFKANFITEVICTIVLICGIMFIVSKPVEMPKYLIPFMIGGLLYVLGAGFGGPTGYGANPARDMGPRIAHAILPIPGKGDNDWKYGLVVATCGPLLGGVISFALCRAAGLI